MKRSLVLVFAGVLILCAPAILFASGDGEDAGGEPVTIEWWGELTGFEALGTQQAVETWNEQNPDIQVVYTGQPDLDTKVIAAVRAGNPPSVVAVGNNQNFPQLVTGGIYQPLDDLLEEGGYSMDRYWQPITNRQMMMDGKIYGLPYTNWALVLVYNKDMFREAGLDPENPPRTFEEFDAANRALTKRDANGNITQMGMALRTVFPGAFVSYFAYQFGATPEDLYDAEARKFLKPEALYQTWEWIQSFPEEYGVDDLREFVGGFGEWGTEAEPFLSGKTAMTWNGPWIADHISRYAPDMDWGVASLPTVDSIVDKGDMSWLGVEPFCIPTGAEHVEQALEFMYWYSGPEGQRLMNTGEDGSGRLPSVRDFGGESFLQEAVTNPKLGQFIKIFDSGAGQPFAFGSPGEQSYNTELGAIRDPVLNLEIDARDAVDQAIERAQSALDRQ